MQGGIHSLPIHFASVMTHSRNISVEIYKRLSGDFPWDTLFTILVILLAMIASYVLLKSWEQEKRREHSYLPGIPARLVALLALTAWMPLATGCFNFGTGSDKGKYKTEELAAAWLWATGGSKEEVTPYTTTTDPETVSTGGAVTTYKTGTQFYNGIVNDSTDLITNESGDAIAQYAYEPFGKIVPEASNLDLDGDGKSYTGGFLYTGQEWELETDVYNFHARTYDAQTGRFMQSDPVFTDRTGFDSYDTYQFVNENPVNFVDPSGESWLSNATKGYGKGLQRATFISKRRAETFTKGLGNVVQGGIGLSLLPVSPLVGLGYGLFTNPSEFINHPAHALSYALGGLDYSLSLTLNPIRGVDDPTVRHYKGGAVMTNSFFADKIEGTSFSLGGFAHLKSSATRQTNMHERGHNRTASFDNFFGGTRSVWDFEHNERQADLKAGTANYYTMRLFYYLTLHKNNPDLYQAIKMYNNYLNPNQIVDWYIMELTGSMYGL